MDRYDQGNRVVVLPPKGQGVIIAVIILIAVIVFAILLIIFLRRRTTPATTSTGTGSTDCVNDIDCSGNDVCDPSNGKCVQCIGDANCTAEKPFCSNGRCLNCVTAADCPSGRPICDPLLHQCIQCSSSSDCGGATPNCNQATHRCVGCITSGDCSGTSDICNPANSICVECLSNAQCTSPAVCNNGQCCDLTPPTITGLSTTSPMPTFHGTYSSTQPLAGLTHIFEVEDSTGFVLFTSGGAPATGTITIAQPFLNSFPTYYAGYTYRVKVRLVSACGSTPYSAPVAIAMTYPPPMTYEVGIIDPATSSVSISQIDIRLTNPDQTSFIFYQASMVISTTPFLDPNRATIQNNVFAGISGMQLQFVAPWPFGVAVGQTYYIRMLGDQGSDRLVVGPPVGFTIPAPP